MKHKLLQKPSKMKNSLPADGFSSSKETKKKTSQNEKQNCMQKSMKKIEEWIILMYLILLFNIYFTNVDLLLK